MNGEHIGFIDIEQYPSVVELCKKIKTSDVLLRKLSKVIPYNAWSDPDLSDDRWKVATMRYAKKDYNPLVSFLNHPEIHASGFSCLEPGAHIKPHTGYSGDIYRLHYGIEVPDGDCALKVKGEVRRWEEGGFLMFNDLAVHEAWNRTDKKRIILLVDIDKESLLL